MTNADYIIALDNDYVLTYGKGIENGKKIEAEEWKKAVMPIIAGYGTKVNGKRFKIDPQLFENLKAFVADRGSATCEQDDNQFDRGQKHEARRWLNMVMPVLKERKLSEDGQRVEVLLEDFDALCKFADLSRNMLMEE